VEYVFSDKTGTLTCNVMEFKKFSAGLKSYGYSILPPALPPQEANVSFFDPDLEEDLTDPSSPNHEAVKRVVMFLACCHTIIIDQKKGTYNASSPDELALVNAAKQFGYEFKDKDSDNNIVIRHKQTGEDISLKLLNVCEFTSTRKRMSCIFRDSRGKIILMCKGADSVISERLSEESKDSELFATTNIAVEGFAREGLRTLYLAEREISETEYEVWAEEVHKAKLEITNREEKVAVVDEKIEVGLELIGSTAIEDRLQDDVAETIKFMKLAGIKVWVLTGDKIETAINIGVSAGLLDSDMDRHEIGDGLLYEPLKKILIKAKQDIEAGKANRKQAIVIAGSALVTIEHSIELKDIFLHASDSADVVLACRVSPKQKADIVNLIRHRFPGKVTLSIGDGANDVNMILQAHVGVGIAGKEGQQAARSADFAIGQFKFLKPLLFVHGREAYRRNSLLVLYSFYKNVLYVVTQFYFGFDSAFAG